MRDTGGQLTNTFEFLCLAKLGFERSALGNVASRAETVFLAIEIEIIRIYLYGESLPLFGLELSLKGE